MIISAFQANQQSKKRTNKKVQIRTFEEPHESLKNNPVLYTVNILKLGSKFLGCGGGGGYFVEE